MHNIAITTECVADLPDSLLKKYEIDIIYYDVETEKGLFRDTAEISAENIVEYMMGGENRVRSVVPSPDDYKNFFKKRLQEYDEIIHICISSKISQAVNNSTKGREKLGLDGHRIHIIDSGHLSSGVGLLVLEAVKMRDQGKRKEEIIDRVKDLIPFVSSSFIAWSADYLYYNGKVSKSVMQFCKTFKLHPVLRIKDGMLAFERVYVGDYNKAVRKYLIGELKKQKKIRKDTGFITYVGCNHDMIRWVEEEVKSRVAFEALYKQQASATISGNSGPGTLGILFIMEDTDR